MTSAQSPQPTPPVSGHNSDGQIGANPSDGPNTQDPTNNNSDRSVSPNSTPSEKDETDAASRDSSAKANTQVEKDASATRSSSVLTLTAASMKDDTTTLNNESNEPSSTPLNAANNTSMTQDSKGLRKRTKVSRACDECRRKKIKCDATFNSQTNQIASVCHNCKKSGDVCTFTRVPLKRGPSKGSISGISSVYLQYSSSSPTRNSVGEQSAAHQQTQSQPQLQQQGPQPQLQQPAFGPYYNQQRNSLNSSISPTTQSVPPVLSSPNPNGLPQQPLFQFQLPPLSQSPHSRILPPINPMNSMNRSLPQSQAIDDQSVKVQSFIPNELSRPRSLSNVETNNQKQQQPPIFWKVPMELPGFSSGTGTSTPASVSMGPKTSMAAVVNEGLNFGGPISSNGESISSTNNNSRRNSVDSLSSSMSNSSNNTFSPSLSSSNLSNSNALGVSSNPIISNNNRNSISLNFSRSRTHSTANSIYDNIGNSDSEDEFLNNNSNRRSTNITLPLTSANGVGFTATNNNSTINNTNPKLRSPRRSSFGKESTISPANSFSSLHSLNQNLTKTTVSGNSSNNNTTNNKPILLKNLESSLDSYYAKHNSVLPILPMNREVILKNILKVFSKDEFISVLETFYIVLQHLNFVDYPKYQIQELLSIFNNLVQIYNSKNYYFINDKSLRIVFLSTLTLINYIVVLSGQPYSLCFGFSFSFMNDWRLNQLFEQVNRDSANANNSNNNLSTAMDRTESSAMDVDTEVNNQSSVDEVTRTRSGSGNRSRSGSGNISISKDITSSPLIMFSVGDSEEDYNTYIRRMYLTNLILDNIYSLSFSISSFNSMRLYNLKFKEGLYFTKKEIDLDSKENQSIGIENYNLGFELIKYGQNLRDNRSEVPAIYNGKNQFVEALLKQQQIFDLFQKEMKSHYLNNLAVGQSILKFQSVAKKEDEDEFYFEFQLKLSKLSKELHSLLYKCFNDPRMVNTTNDTVLILPFINVLTIKCLKLVSLTVFLIDNLIRLNTILGSDDFKSRLNKICLDLTNLSSSIINERKYPIGTVVELIGEFDKSVSQNRRRSLNLTNSAVGIENSQREIQIAQYVELCCIEINREIDSDEFGGWLYN